MDSKRNPREGGQQSDCGRHSTTPPTASLDFEQIPAELKARPQWLCWQLETRDGAPIKVPKSARTGRNASTTQPDDWCDFEMAVAAYQKGGYDGIGFVFTRESGIVGIDLDECIDAETGELAAWAQAVVAELDSYTEVSPSGRGLHAYVVGTIPQSRKKGGHASSAIEIYDKGRYFTVTGRRFTENRKVEARQEALDRVYTRAFGNGASGNPDHATSPPQSATSPPPNLALTDAELLDKAMAATNGDKFRDLWRGDTSAYGGDDSAADLALCLRLAFWTQKDAGRMDRLFRQSGLMRPKWDSRRGDTTYGQMTLDKAIAECTEVYTEGGKGNGHDSAPPPDYSDYPESRGYEKDKRAGAGPTPPTEQSKLPRIVICIGDLTIEPSEPPFSIDGYMPRDVQALIGTGGTGKSTLDMLQGIHLILGRPLWDMPILAPGPVVYVTAEDGEDRLKWRLFHIVNQLGLTRSERQQVANNFHIVNLVGTGRKLVAQDRDGNLVITSLADQLIEEFLPIAPVRVSFDPMVKFGPGERMVNDGEDMLVNAGHRITQNLHCATNFTHHVSKDVARNGIVDHHSGRGGSALGDGVRAAYQLLTITPELAKNKSYPGVEIYRGDIEDGRLLALHITKLTDAKRPLEPLILRRNGWLFEPVEMPERLDPEQARIAANRERAIRNVDALVSYLNEFSFRKFSRNELEETHKEIGIGRNDVRGAIASGIVHGRLAELELPENEKRGTKKTYIAVIGGAS